MATILVLNQDPASLSATDLALLGQDTERVRFDFRDNMGALIARIRELWKTGSVGLFSKTYFDPTLIVFELGVSAVFDQRVSPPPYIIYL